MTVKMDILVGGFTLLIYIDTTLSLFHYFAYETNQINNCKINTGTKLSSFNANQILK